MRRGREDVRTRGGEAEREVERRKVGEEQRERGGDEERRR